jgi:hypothetical protein
VIAASIFVVAGVENGAGLSLSLGGKYGLYGYHTFQFEPLDQWVNGSMDTVIMEMLILKRLTHMEQFHG